VPKRVVIVGGGITGLAAAYELERAADVEIDLYEASSRLGGKLQTSLIDGLTVELGPDCFFTRKPGVRELIEELGLEGEVIEPGQKEFSLLLDGTLHRVPAGLVTLNTANAEAVHEATFLSPEGKARALAEREQPAGAGEDESIRAFFTRRFGAEFATLVAEPMLAGTHGGEPDRLSMRALFPGYLELERRHGSLAAGIPVPTGAAAFLSFRNGMQTVVDGLARALQRTRIHLNTRGSVAGNDPVLLAIPANVAAPILDGKAGALMKEIAHRSSTIVTLAFRRDQIKKGLQGTGFLVPPSSPLPVTGATWSSEKWPGRAPENQVLMRVFLRGTVMDALNVARDTLDPLLGIKGAPLLSQTARWIEGQPQYEVGHLDRVAEIEAALPSNILVAGTSYRGVGVPDCLRQGREAARKLLERI
jgi:oxygen-dependent protoporphyrinogen oxidase